MATKTSNYQLTKPIINENYDVGIPNANMDIIDTQLKANADAAAAAVPKSLATAVSQFLVSTAAGAWAVKTVAEIKTLLGLGSAAYTASTAYATSAQGTTADGAISKSLGTAADQMLVSTSVGVWAVKTLAQVKTWLGLGSAAYTDSTAYAAATHKSRHATGGTDVLSPADIGAAALDTNSKVTPAQASAAIVAVGASKTLALTDAGSFQNVSGAYTLTIPLNSAVAFPVGTEIEIFVGSNNTVTITGSAGVYFYLAGGTAAVAASAKTIAKAFTSIVVKQIAANYWSIQGGLS